MAEHHGKGHPAFTEQQAIDYLKREGVAITAELAEEFDVSDVAVRKRLKDMPGVETRKIRNRRVWFVPHDEPEMAHADGGAGFFGGPMQPHLSPAAGQLVDLFIYLIPLGAISAIYGYLMEPSFTQFGLVVGLAGLILTFAAGYVMVRFKPMADPSSEGLWDIARHLTEIDRYRGESNE